MKRDVRLYLDDIQEAIERIEDYTDGRSEHQFLDEPLLQDGVLRRLSIIGEAAKHIPKRLRDQHPEIPWQQVAGFRDILIHEYFGIRLRNAWKVVQDDLTPLKETIRAMQRDLP